MNATSSEANFWLRTIREDLEYVPPEARAARFRGMLQIALGSLSPMGCYEFGGLVRADRRLIELLGQGEALPLAPGWPGKGEPIDQGLLDK
jgi:hypothetical protein